MPARPGSLQVSSESAMAQANAFSYFFFSSRRRHTRCSRDWSSDVCSSDLLSSEVGIPLPKGASQAVELAAKSVVRKHGRSGERRVGKEGRARGSPYH